MFKDRYGIEEKQIVAFKNELKEKLVKSLFSLVEDFSIFKHLVKEATYPYIDDRYTDLELLLRQMDAKSEVFVRIESTGDSMDGIKLLFLALLHEQCAAWEDKVNQNFGQKPIVYYDSPEYKITLLRVEGLKPAMVSLLR